MKQRAFDDLQRELAGVDVGRQERFLTGEERSPRARDEKERRRARDDLTRLQLMMQNEAYAAAYARVSDLIDQAEVATLERLGELESVIADECRSLEGLTERARTLPDGTAVFRNAEGQAVTSEGRVLDAHEVTQVAWQHDAPSYEDYLTQKRRLEALEAEREAAIRYQTEVLDDARERLDDADGPPSLDELEEIEARVKDQAPASVQEALDLEIEDEPSPSQDRSLDPEPSAPKLGVPSL